MRPYLIVGTFRTGSSALAEQLGMHERITCGWESTEHVFGQARIRLAEEFLLGDFSGLREKEQKFLSETHNEFVEAIGFRLLFGSTSKWFISPRICPVHIVKTFRAHMRWIAGRTDIAIIHIVRRDNVEWLKSIAFARASRCYFGAKYPAGLTLTLSLREALKRVKMKSHIGRTFSELQRTHRYARVYYEDFRASNADIVGGLYRFLGCDSSGPFNREPKLAIQSDETHILENADSIKAMLVDAGLRYEE